MKNSDAVLFAYKKAMGNSDWYQTRALPWRKRLRRYPFLTLRYALIDRFWNITIALGLHGPFLQARTFWGDHMQIVFPDYRSIYHHGLIDGRELPVENFLVQFLQEGDVCIDIGANVGFYTLLASVLVGESGKVHAFEPTPRTFEVLCKNTADKNNVMRINAALMDAEGKRRLVDYGVLKSGLNAILPDSGAPEALNVVPVETTTLDSYCLMHGIRPTFIKIDTEGAEEMVLKGGRRTLEAHHPTLIIEVQRESPQSVVALLADIGYRAYQFAGNTPAPYVSGDAIACPNMLFMYGN
ncbi:MAG: FkbM family methyltransferase [Patescibacteria group bacterium]